MQECSSDESPGGEDDALCVVSAFDVPRFTYSAERKKYLPDAVFGKHAEPNIYAGTLSSVSVRSLIGIVLRVRAYATTHCAE